MSEFNTHGGYFAPAGYMKVETGGSHEENPNGGVQIGVDPQGVPNMLEQNEPVYNDFVFSDNIVVTKEMAEAHNLPKQIVGKLYSEAVQYFMDEAEERSFDSVSRNGLEAMLGRLAEAQEEQKQIDDERKLEEELANMSPEELAELENMLAAQEQQAQVAPEQAMAQQIPEEQMMTPEEQMMQQQMAPQPIMRRGGPMNTFTGGGGVQDGTKQNGQIDPVVNTEYLPPINTELGRRYARNMAARVSSGQMNIKDVPSKYYSYVQGEVQGAQPVREGINDEGVKTAVGTVSLPLSVIAGAELAGPAIGFLANPANSIAVGKTLTPLLTGAAIDEGVSAYTPYENVGDAVYRGSGLQGLLHQYVPESAQPYVDTFGEMAGEALNPGWYTGGMYGKAAERIAGAGIGRGAQPVTEEAVANALNSAETPASAQTTVSASEASASADNAAASSISGRAGRRSARIERKAARSQKSAERAAEYAKKQEIEKAKKDALKEKVKKAKEALAEDKSNLAKAKQEVRQAKDDIRAGANLKYGSKTGETSEAGTADELLNAAKTRYSNALDSRSEARKALWGDRGNLFTARAGRVGQAIPGIANATFNPYHTFDFLHNGQGWRTGWSLLPALSQAGTEMGLGWSAYKGLTEGRPERVSKESLNAGDFIDDTFNFKCGGKMNRYDGTVFGQSSQLLLPNKTYPWQKPIAKFSPLGSPIEPLNIQLSGPLYDIDTDKTAPIAETGWRPKDNTLLGWKKPVFNVNTRQQDRVATPVLSTLGKWAAPGLSLAQAAWNLGKDGDRYDFARMPVSNLSVPLHLQNPRYRAVDVNQAENRNLAQENALFRAIRNSGVGPGTPTALLAADYRTGQNRGNGFNTIWDYNNNNRNQVISGVNQNAATAAQFDYATAKAREDAALAAAKIDVQNDLLRQVYENRSDQDYANAFINSARDAANFLYNEGISNRNLNQANSRRDLYDYAFPNGSSIYRGAPSARRAYYASSYPYWMVGDGGFIKKLK